MGKLEKFGRSILKKLGASGRNQNQRHRGSSNNATSSSSTSSGTSSDEEQITVTPQRELRNVPSIATSPGQAYVHSFQVVPSEEQEQTEHVAPEDVRVASPTASDEGSAGYATDDTALSSLSPLDVKRVSVDYSESQGYYSTAELSPIPTAKVDEAENRRTPTIPKIIVPTPVTSPTPRTPLYLKKPSQEYPRVNVNVLKKDEPMYKSSQGLGTRGDPLRRSATLSNLTASGQEDPIDRFLKSSIYKTKMITTVFEAKDNGIEEIYQDVLYEIDRWFETKNMMAVACEMHWSVPREKRSRKLESRLKEKLLNALRENNKRLLYLRGMGRGKTPVKLAESKTVENISRDRETDSVRGIYQRSYTRLLPYLHKETPEWHSQYWTLQDLQEQEPNENVARMQEKENPLPSPENFLFNAEPPEILAKNSLISLNIIGLSILGNSRKSCGSLFNDDF
uniref:Uncharacterized protein n=1 Tax=Caenorhabditis japonica TaxID=281687 RepID=A0A8R1ENQ8_CAEJA